MPTQKLLSSLWRIYVGLRIFENFIYVWRYKSVDVWDGAVTRFEKRPTRWKDIFLSKVGKLTPIKSTFSSLPTCNMFILTIAASITRDWRRSSVMGEFKFQLLNWDKVCGPVRKSIRHFKNFNKALQARSLGSSKLGVAPLFLMWFSW